MPELTQDEYWVLNVYFRDHGFTNPHGINQIGLYLGRLMFHRTDEVLESLLSKKVLSKSPDGHNVRVTDYGLELFQNQHAAQENWWSQPIIMVSKLDRDQIVIRAGETFTANRVLREIFALAKSDIAIIDPYVGEGLFDLLEPVVDRIKISILTAATPARTALNSYKAFRAQYTNCEMRLESGLHDRYILLDHASGFHCGHSLKDLGTKDSQLNLLTDPLQHWAAFDARWGRATPVPP